MSLTSVRFLFFIVAVFFVYFVTPKRYQYLTLLAGSYVFYYWLSAGVMVFLLITTATVFFGALALERCNARMRSQPGDATPDPAARAARKKSLSAQKKWILTAVLLVNFGILALLKYGELINATLRLVWPVSTGDPLSFRALALPLGISFYTFQSVGYLIDVYRGKYAAERNPAKFALFVSFFPQIIQGPIARYDSLAQQLFEPHTFDFQRAKDGILLIGWGFIKKLIVADRLAALVTTVFAQPADYGGSILFVAAFTYGLQVYCDFSAGMDIAGGVAEVMGIRIAKNFQQPYYANAIADFWRRWHITLGTWMRDYLFYPLSLSRPFGRLAKTVRNRWGMRWSKIIVSGIISFIVFTVVGIWHGAEVKYILYGFWNGTLIMLAILLEPLFARALTALHIRQDSRAWRAFRIVRTLVLLSIGRSIVCSLSASTALAAIGKMVFAFAPADLFGGTLGTLGMNGFDYAVVAAVLAVVFWIDHLHEQGKPVRASLARAPLVWRWALYFVMIFALLMLTPAGGTLSGNFIYAQF
jgi:D-alanyl-lipoteichoic acid acyltransferase DltB (MBOAT superfamily)